MHDMLIALFFFLPAGAANGIPVLAALAPGLRKFDTPMDFGLKVRGRELFGKNKTWRGMIAGIIAATLLLWLQQQLTLHWHSLYALMDEINYTNLNPLILGPLFGVGALVGDALESFVKRQVGHAPGKSWFPFDQLDFIIGAIIFTLPCVALSLSQYAWAVVVLMVLHVLFDRGGELFHLKERIK
jgi:CDP-2,3-bis-(O-geranylgeranyl)-sn-glycerol synthase